MKHYLKLVLVVLGVSVWAQSSWALGTKLYTTTADFQGGTLYRVVANNDELKLGQCRGENFDFHFIWVPNSNGTVSKVDTETGKEVARYKLGLDEADPNPSRTAIDLNGHCWIGCRNTGTVVKIGNEEAGGWIDRNVNGRCDTSWDKNDDGDITGDEILDLGDDECVLYEVLLEDGQEETYVPGTCPLDSYRKEEQGGPAPRGLAVDGLNNLWVGTMQDNVYYINGADGRIEQKICVSELLFPSEPYQAYGAIVDRNGVFWSCYYNHMDLLRLDPAPSPPAASKVYVPGNYGIGLDYSNHVLTVKDNRLWKININDIEDKDYLILPGLNYGTGVVCKADNHIWVADYMGDAVLHYNSNGELVDDPFTVGNSPRAVSVDAAGKVWTCDLEDLDIWRIDPITHAVDSKALLDSGSGSQYHYGYGDMTGWVAWSTLPEEGTWTVTYDSERPMVDWGVISWSSSEPEGTRITVEVRSSEDNTNWSPWERAVEGQAPLTTPDGRYLRVRVRFTSTVTSVTPILYDLTVTCTNRFVTNTDSVTVPEGSTADFQVKLLAEPLSEVVASVAWASGDTDITVQSGSSLTFNSSNWSTYQTVTLAAAEDADCADGTATIRISHPDFANKCVTATEEDNDFITIDEAKKAADGYAVRLNDAIVSASFLTEAGGGLYKPGAFAVEEVDKTVGSTTVYGRFSGIRVISDVADLVAGDKVDIRGSTATLDGERVILADTVTEEPTPGTAPAPFSIANIDTGGGDYGYQGAVVNVYDDTQPPPVPPVVVMCRGMNNVGILMKLRGRVTAVLEDGTYGSYIYVDDAYGLHDEEWDYETGLKDGSKDPITSELNIGVRCRPPASVEGPPILLPAVDDYVEVTGVMGVRKENGINTRYLWATECSEPIATFTPYSHGYCALWNLLSLPGQPKNPDPAEIFDGQEKIDGRLYRWDAPAQGQFMYDMFDPKVFGAMNISEGYWLNAAAAGTLSYDGFAALTDDRWISAPNGWKKMGMPFTHSTMWPDWMATDGTAMKNIHDASQWGAGWMLSYGYFWDPVNQGQLDFGLEDDFPSTSQLDPWYGYQIRTYKHLGLIAPAGSYPP